MTVIHEPCNANEDQGMEKWVLCIDGVAIYHSTRAEAIQDAEEYVRRGIEGGTIDITYPKQGFITIAMVVLETFGPHEDVSDEWAWRKVTPPDVEEEEAEAEAKAEEESIPEFPEYNY